MSVLKNGLVSAIALLGITAAASAQAQVVTVPITIADGWQPFDFLGVGSPFADFHGYYDPTYGDYGDTIDFTFTLASQTNLKVTDAFYTGDQFDIIINGHNAGVTSAPTLAVEDVLDYDVAYADPNYSHRIYHLNPGVYTVTGTVTQELGGYGLGSAALELSAPEPATWFLLLGGFGGMGAVLRRRRGALAC